ncbi:MAG: tetratricopeptide repeat protein [Desulfamplus sp.]|nr:tetratricopeptide repeat protein [Desulfamplus sp.]
MALSKIAQYQPDFKIPSIKDKPLELSQSKLEEINQKTLLALELQEQDNIVEATKLFKEILLVNPAHFPSLYSLGVIASKNEENTEALSLIEKAIQVIPTYAPAHFAKAVILQALKRYNDALVSYQQALTINPDYLDAMNNRGNLLHEMKQYDLAFASFAEIIKRNPNADKALSNSGIILTLKNQYEESIDFFDRLLKANPDFDYARGLLFYSQLHCCDWSEYDKHSELINRGIQDGKRECKSLAFMAFSNSASDSLECAKIFASHFFPKKSKTLWNGERYNHKKIRIAYVSPDFRQHPVGHLMAGVIENHDKSKVETIAISIGIDDKSILRNRFIAAFSQFYDVQMKTSFEIAQLIRNLEVDILVDLAGYTADSRTDIFAYRPAPVQVNYLGYPGTMGLDYIDYILADRYVIPEEHKRFYTEKVAYMPHTYLPTDGNLKVSERTPTREEMNLPPQGVIFCSFNHDYKINPQMFSVWMRILEKVEGSVLWLMKLNEAAERNLKKEAKNRGINPDRLIFATRIPLIEDHLARYRLADIFLDTSPYNAHTTASDALFAGLPVLTYMGDTFSARVAGSLLNAIGVPELITHSLEEYEELAVKLALNSQMISELKEKLIANKESYPLFKTKLFAENLEEVFIEIVNLETAL